MIETSERKVTVMSAKPSSLPPLLEPPEVKSPKIIQPSGPSYNDAFARFLAGNSKRKEREDLTSPQKQSPEVVASTKVTIEITKHSSPHCNQEDITKLQESPTSSVTVVQRKQEAWTSKVLEQTEHLKKLVATQKVKTERIEPYVSGQNHLYTNEVRSEDGQKLFYTIESSQSQRSMKANGQGFKQKQQS